MRIQSDEMNIEKWSQKKNIKEIVETLDLPPQKSTEMLNSLVAKTREFFTDKNILNMVTISLEGFGNGEIFVTLTTKILCEDYETLYKKYREPYINFIVHQEEYDNLMKYGCDNLVFNVEQLNLDRYVSKGGMGKDMEKDDLSEKHKNDNKIADPNKHRFIYIQKYICECSICKCSDAIKCEILKCRCCPPYKSSGKLKPQKAVEILSE
jgi:hypothetical protein